MPRPVQGEEREHTSIPVPQSHAVFLVHLVLDIEAPAGGAGKGADTAVDASKLDLIPKICLEECFFILIL